MKNADMPAMPTHDVFEHCGFDGNSGPHMTQTANYGLTKREMMAMHMMSGMLSSGTNDSVAIERIVKISVIYSDALLAELDRTSK